jgi:tetratricopeptide (TPR) repeat protein
MLAEQAQPGQQTADILILLANRLIENDQEQAARILLQKAFLTFPADFWVATALNEATIHPIRKEVYCRATLAIRPKSPYARANLASTLHQWQLKTAEAIGEYKSAIALDPTSSNAYWNLAYILPDEQDRKSAILSLEQCVLKHAKVHANSAHTHYMLGAVHSLQKHPDKAETAYRKAIELDPDHLDAHQSLGDLLDDKNDLEGAMKEYCIVLALAPSWTVVHNNIAYLLGKQGKYLESIEFLKTGLAANPAMADRWNHLLVFPLRVGGAIHALKASIGTVKDAAQLSETEKTEYRQQALAWLKDEIAVLHKHLNGAPKNNVRVRALLGGLLFQQTSYWQSVRDEKALAKIPQPERQEWQKLWLKVEFLLEQFQTELRPVKKWEGTLNAKTKEQFHTISLDAGVTYILEMKSNKLDSILKVCSAQGKVLAEDDDSGANQDAAIIFTPMQSGTYQLVATSFKMTGNGPYTLIVSEFRDD